MPSFRSDVSFPEPRAWNGDDDKLIPNAKQRHGPAYRLVKERDTHELWAVLRLFRYQYGDAYLQTVIDDAKANPL